MVDFRGFGGFICSGLLIALMGLICIIVWFVRGPEGFFQYQFFIAAWVGLFLGLAIAAIATLLYLGRAPCLEQLIPSMRKPPQHATVQARDRAEELGVDISTIGKTTVTVADVEMAAGIRMDGNGI
eukprot:TRINITY_DN44335_c0_g1_i1.p1 TRINITY_DN44335_c0_g1~~TRINITY_DN44335_c0_g1_i1.p1  ORF type:complete len:126 (+),score=20.63 TRINITY_DN44335_c0_g1_i1:53-430(+)